MPFRLEKPPPILLPTAPTFPLRGHTRSPSRASPTRPRITDDLLSDLSPNTTLAAFTSSSSPSSGKLRASVEAASPGEREFGIRAATAANKIKEWVNELTDWPWPESGSAGFEAPVSKRRKLLASEKLKAFNEHAATDGSKPGYESEIPTSNDVKEDRYCGSLYAKDVIKYSIRIDEILDDMDDLDVGGIKSHILDLHVPSRSRPTSSASAASTSGSSLSSYTKMDDFTAVITATVLQALPNLARLQMLLDVWGIRLILLRQVNPLLDALADAETAVRSGWRALDISDKGKVEGNGDHIAGEHQHLSRYSLNTMQKVLQSKVALVGQKLDRMLDALEGRQDTLPEAWLDRMDLLERQYADWVALANKTVLEGEWEEQNNSAEELHESVGKDHLETPKAPSTMFGNDEKAQASQKSIPVNSTNESQVQDNELPNEEADLVKRSSLVGDVSIIPQIAPSLIFQLDGGLENTEDRAQTEPITPQTPTITAPGSSEIEAEASFLTAPPSSKFDSAIKISPNHLITDQQVTVESSHIENMPRTANFGYGQESQSESEIRTDAKLKIADDPSLVKPESSTGVMTESDPRQSPAIPRKLSDAQLDATVLDRSNSEIPRNSILGGRETLDREKSNMGNPETPSDVSPMSSVTSSYAPSEPSPSANRVPPARHTRRVLSPIQSSTEWFDFGDAKTPTKGALREDPNILNLPSQKQDGQKTPTLNENFGTYRKIISNHEGLDDEERRTRDNSVDFERDDTDAASEALTPIPKVRPILSFDEASPEEALPPLISRRKSSQLLASPDFSTPFKIPETPLEPPMLPNIDVLEAPRLFSPVKGSADQLQQQISDILESLSAPIRLATETEKNPFPDLKIPKKRPGLKKTVSASSLRLPSRSPTPTPSFTLAPAYSKNSPRPRHQNANPEIKLYHLSRSNGGAPIKLFVRLVGENGERVMVRVGGGWADLGEYLREYAIHHSRRNAPEDKIQIHDSSSRIVSSSSILSARSGRSSPVSRPGSSMDGPISRPATSMGNRRTSINNERPTSSLAIRKNRNPRKSFGDEARNAQYRSPSTPMPAMNRRAVSKQETPPSATSTGSRSSSRLSFNNEDSYLGLSGPRSKHIELSEESEKWVEDMTERVKQASAEKEKKQTALLGELGKAGSTKRLFKKS